MADIYVKLEWENPTGSMKDRMALNVIERAEEDGKLGTGGTVLEYTGGSTGTSLAFVAAAKGYTCKIVTYDQVSPDKLRHMEMLGAEMVIIDNQGQGITKELINSMVSKAHELGEEKNTFLVDQLNNPYQLTSYESLGREIWEQTDGKVDAFVHTIGTAASFIGTAKHLKGKNPNIRCVAVEPEESAFLSRGESGSHDIEGVGIGYRPPLWQDGLADDYRTASTNDAKEMMSRLAKEEGLFSGISAGANVIAALEIAKELGPGKIVVTLMCDSGLKYLSKGMLQTTWKLHENYISNANVFLIFNVRVHFMPVNPVFDLKGWFQQNEDTLKPPVGNKLVYEDSDWIVMAVGGPNARRDYHFHYRGPEFFYMVKGSMVLKIKREDENGNLINDDVTIREGEIFLLPRETIHSPQRPAGSWGLVLEGKALRGEKDHLRWYCEKCNDLLADYQFDLNNIVTELPPLMKQFFDSDDLRTCKSCGFKMSDPEPFVMPE